MVSGAINYGLGSAGGPLHPWKYMYLFAGGLTIIWAFVILLFLPISPLEPGRFFSAEEREILGRRFQENPWGKDRMCIKKYQAMEALADVKTWLYMLIAAAIYVSSGNRRLRIADTEDM
jgi:MFS family permease